MLIASIDTKSGRTHIAVKWVGQGESPSFAEHVDAVATVARALVGAESKPGTPAVKNNNVVYGAFANPAPAQDRPAEMPTLRPTPQRIKEAVRLLTRAAGTSDVAEQCMLVSTAMLVLNSFDLGQVPA